MLWNCLRNGNAHLGYRSQDEEETSTACNLEEEMRVWCLYHGPGASLSVVQRNSVDEEPSIMQEQGADKR